MIKLSGHVLYNVHTHRTTIIDFKLFQTNTQNKEWCNVKRKSNNFKNKFRKFDYFYAWKANVNNNNKKTITSINFIRCYIYVWNSHPTLWTTRLKRFLKYSFNVFLFYFFSSTTTDVKLYNLFNGKLPSFYFKPQSKVQTLSRI